MSASGLKPKDSISKIRIRPFPVRTYAVFGCIAMPIVFIRQHLVFRVPVVLSFLIGCRLIAAALVIRVTVGFSLWLGGV